MKYLPSCQVSLACLSLLCLSSLAQAQDYDAAKYFRSNTNADAANPFKYGFTPTLAGKFSLYGNYSANAFPPFNSPIAGFYDTGTASNVPAVLYNNSPSQYSVHSGDSDITIGSHQLALHPGSDGQYSVVRFTVQKTGLYNVAGLFAEGDSHPTTTDVHVLLTNSLLNTTTSLFNSGVHSNGNAGSTANYALSKLQLTSGEYLDFVVGYGIGGVGGQPDSYIYDTTLFNAKIAAVPELSTLFGFGSLVLFGGIGAFRQRKQSNKAA